jgi:prophage regulatory protein
MKKALTVHQVTSKTGLCRSYIWKLEKVGKFPRSFKVGLRAIRWLESDIDAWLEEKRAESN